jgi:hypothetical protein
MLPRMFYFSKQQILIHCRFFSLRLWIARPKDWKERLRKIRRKI